MILRLSRRLEKNEWYFLGGLSLFLMILASFPYILGYFLKPQNMFFLSVGALAPADKAVYYSYIEQSKQGALFFCSYATPLETVCDIFNPFWLVIGKIAKLFHLSSVFAFHFFRIFLIPFYVFVNYLFFSLIFKKIQYRKMALILLCFSLGLGFYYFLLFPDSGTLFSEITGYYHFPMDLWVSESHFFLTLFSSPHFIFSAICFLMAIIFLYHAFYLNKVSYAIYAGLSCLLLYSFHPYHLPTFFLLLTFFTFFELVKDKKLNFLHIWYCVLFFLISSPSFLYYVFLTKHNWIKDFHAAANITLTPLWYMTIISFGFPFFFSLLGFWYFFWHKKVYKTSFLFLYAWYVSSFMAMYLPLLFQRRLVQNSQVIIVTFCVIGLVFLYRLIEKKASLKIRTILFHETVLMGFFLFFFFMTSFFVLSREIVVLTNYPVSFLQKDSYEAMTWAKSHVSENDAFLATFLDRAYFPAFALHNTFVFHGHESPLSLAEFAFYDWFFLTNVSDEHKYEWLQKNHISYIFVNEENKKTYENINFDLSWNNPIKLEEKSYLEPVYENEGVVIYKVK